MKTYTYRMSWGDTLRIRADLTQASAPIYLEDNGDWTATVYQTADACHDRTRMLQLVVEALGPDWYADPTDNASADEQLHNVIESAKLVAETN